MAVSRARPARRVDRDLRAIGGLTQAVLDGDDLEGLLGRIAVEAVPEAGKLGLVGYLVAFLGTMLRGARIRPLSPVRDGLTTAHGAISIAARIPASNWRGA